ncbi:Ribosome quality control complex subunit 2 [Hyphodiscus hymeniophilus]|uniref:Ribosome quality control complex subunit 2 n=1 Tax=Hyphodiscus hymeniophilus TaxID=353542 RepID=A0A9P6VL75_9HELO|nr:Ribosome quality control complex subunit 2 [Hyphodiscus hymeniophilus]
MKQRFSSLDVKVVAHELSNTLLTLRVSNVYDLSSKIFLVKFAKPNHKEQIVIDSGFRCHLTEYSRATASAPSPFVERLRKHLKTRRVTAVSQVGTDRIIEFQFSEGQYRLFLEFYASGNVVLTDKDLNILALLRIVSESEGQGEQRVGLKYTLDNRQNYGGIPPLTKERLHDALQKAVDRGDDGLVAGKKPKKKTTDALRKALAVSITEYPPMLVDHAMRVTNFDASLKPADVLGDDGLLDQLMESLREARRVVEDITSSEVAKGFILATKKDTPQAVDDTSKNWVYDDFHPFRPRQFEDDPKTTFLEFAGFNKTVDEFFSSIEGQKLESRLEEREAMAKRKFEAARQDQAKRLGGLQEVQELNMRKAAALQANAERVLEAMDAVNGLIAQGMDWVEIGKLIELEQKRHNPVASMIRLPLKLQENTVTLLLDKESFDEEEDSAYETDSDVSNSEDEGANKAPKQRVMEEKRLTTDVNLSLSPWANAREYYDQRRTAVVKEQKTLQSSNMALKSTEAKIAQDLKKGLKQEKAILRPVRRQMWFEKFAWFISSDGYLVLGGKDAQQNEILYRKYLKKGDAYLHADLHGAASIVVKNNPMTPDAPIPPSTLSQAGTMAVAASSAWESKAGMSAWWVNADQVSKSASTGEFLPTGSFMVRGKKNFLPPAQLVLGFGVLFSISEESKARHVKHRVHEEPVGGSEAGAPTAGDTALEESHDMEDGDRSEDEDEREDETTAQDSRGNPLQTRVQTRDLAELHLQDSDGEEALTRKVEEVEMGEGKSLPAELEDEASESEDELTSEQPTTGTQTPNQPQKGQKGPGPAKRGKKGKAKKIAQKYKDQDEEDRLAAQQLIGAATGLEKAEAEAKAKATREAELAFQKERRKAQHQRTQKETAEHEEVRKMMLEEGVDVLDEGEEEEMTSLDGLVGTPLPGDEILDAIPMCAPWTAMGKCKYKVKLQPGTVKKGKAIKEILAKWVGDLNHKGKVDEGSTDMERMWPREIELLKGWKVEEVTGTICVGKVRVVTSGGMAGGNGGGDRGKSGGKGGRGGKGSKKQR